MKRNILRKLDSASAAPQIETRETGNAGPAATAALDRLIHERLRLGILSALAVNRSLTFNELKKLLGTTDGNLSVHARKLEDAQYVSCTKGFDGRVPRTEYQLTDSGRKAFEKYLNHMEALIQNMKNQGPLQSASKQSTSRSSSAQVSAPANKIRR